MHPDGPQYLENAWPSPAVSSTLRSKRNVSANTMYGQGQPPLDFFARLGLVDADISSDPLSAQEYPHGQTYVCLRDFLIVSNRTNAPFSYGYVPTEVSSHPTTINPCHIDINGLSGFKPCSCPYLGFQPVCCSFMSSEISSSSLPSDPCWTSLPFPSLVAISDSSCLWDNRNPGVVREVCEITLVRYLTITVIIVDCGHQRIQRCSLHTLCSTFMSCNLVVVL
jgi:hypothetical protein